MVEEVARWPGYAFNAQIVVQYRYAMYRDMPRGIYSFLKVEMGVEWMA